MLWIRRLEDAPDRLADSVVWMAPHADAAGWRLPSPSPDDLADAALARRDGGGPRLLRRRLLRALVARSFGLHPDAVRFHRTDRGAPGVNDLSAFISAAGCEGWSAVALARRPVGVDIELEAPATGDGDRAAGPRWTLVEAYVKALGCGLALAPDAVSVRTGDRSSWRLKAASHPDGRGEVLAERGMLAAVVELAGD